MREFLQLSMKLLAFTLIAGLLLALTNAVTEGPIAEQQLKKENASRFAVFPDAESFEPVEDMSAYADKYPAVTAMYKAMRGDETLGYTMNLSAAGYKSQLGMTVGISTGGAVTGVTVDSQSETQGVGSRITEPAFLDQFTGKAASADVLASEIDTITGATVSTSTVRAAVQSAAQLSETELGIEPNEQIPMDPADEYRTVSMPGASGFEGVDLLSFLGDYDTVKGVKYAYNGGELIGYSFDLSGKGYGGAIPMTLGLSVDGMITGLDIGETSESADYGKKIENPDYYSQFTGIPATDEGLAAVDGISGATGTSNEVIRAVRQAIAFHAQYLSDKPEAPDATSSASGAVATEAPDATSSASGAVATEAPDATSSASGAVATEAPDATSSASGAVATEAPDASSSASTVATPMPTLIPTEAPDTTSSASTAATAAPTEAPDAVTAATQTSAVETTEDITGRMSGSEDSYPLIALAQEVYAGDEVTGYRFTTFADSEHGVPALVIDIVAGKIAAVAAADEADAAAAQAMATALNGTLLTADAVSGATAVSDGERGVLAQCAAFYAAYISGEEAAA